MIRDRLSEYCEQLDLTGKPSGKSQVGNIIDHSTGGAASAVGTGAAGTSFASATQGWLTLALSDPITAAGAARVKFLVETSDDSLFPADSTDEILSTGAYPKTKLGTGTLISLAIPFAYKRFSRCCIEVENGPLTCGTLTAGYVTSWPELP